MSIAPNPAFEQPRGSAVGVRLAQCFACASWRAAQRGRSPLAPLGENAAVSGDCLTPRAARGEPGSQDGRPLRGPPLTAALGMLQVRTIEDHMPDEDSRSLDILGIKPVADSVNRLTRAAVDGASAFLSRICLPAAEELGMLFRDKVASWRARNAVLVVDRAREKLEARGPEADQLHAHPRIVGQIIDAGSWSESDDIQDLWGGLLASSCTEDGRDESNLIFANLLGQLTSLQARVITYGCETATKAISPGGWIYAEDVHVDEAQLRQITGVDDIYRLDRELDFLRALELIEEGFDFNTRIANITPTPLALQLFMRCRGYRGDPSRFYGVASAATEDLLDAGGQREGDQRASSRGRSATRRSKPGLKSSSPRKRGRK